MSLRAWPTAWFLITATVLILVHWQIFVIKINCRDCANFDYEEWTLGRAMELWWLWRLPVAIGLTVVPVMRMKRVPVAVSFLGLLMLISGILLCVVIRSRF